MKNIASDQSTSRLIPDPTHQQIQPNAVDLKLNRVWAYEQNGLEFEISEKHKQHRQSYELQPILNGAIDQYVFYLTPGVYEVQFEGIVEIGSDEAGWVITRSTLNRNGLFLTSGLYDSGYKGAMAGCLHVTGGNASIARGTRIGQFLTFKAEALKMYDGSYGIDAKGIVKEQESKYHGVNH